MYQNDMQAIERANTLQRQIDALTFTTDHLGRTVSAATEKVGENEERLEQLMAQVARMDGTILRMRADLPTKDDLDIALKTTLNSHLAKGVWTSCAIGVGAVMTWILNHIKL